MKSIGAALVAGLLFGVGLVMGGMTQPSKVVGFLDVTGAWDPSLGLVMAGAIAVFFPVFRVVARRERPLWSPAVSLPTRHDVDARLVIGASLFGVGWGLAGYCPGPGITSSATLAPNALLFTAAMLLGFRIERWLDRRWVEAPTSERANAPEPAPEMTT